VVVLACGVCGAAAGGNRWKSEHRGLESELKQAREVIPAALMLDRQANLWASDNTPKPVAPSPLSQNVYSCLRRS
jgi:hypothetical protein